MLSLLDVVLSSPYYHIKTKYNNIYWISKSKRKKFYTHLRGLMLIYSMSVRLLNPSLDFGHIT